MQYINNPSDNLMSHCSGTRDGHGGHAAEHREEMRQIAQEEIAKIIPQIQQDAYAQAVNALLQALQVDVTTVVDIALETGESIFHDAKTKHVIMKSIFETIKQNLQADYTIK